VGVEENAEAMLGVYRSWASLLSSGYASGLEASRALGEAPERVVFCGMGTSGFAGAYAGFTLDEAGWARYWWLSRGPRPRYAGPGTLVVAVSYSGTTAETVACARRAALAGSRVAGVTSGGDLAKLADPVAALEPGKPQRTSLAEMVGAAAGLLSAGPHGARLGSLVESAASALSLPAPGSVEEAAEAAARSPLVVVAGCGYLGWAAQRWRTELAENTKRVAKAEEYPESGHNDLVAYQEPLGAQAAFIVLRDPQDRVCREILDAVTGIYEKHGQVITVTPEGDTRPARLLRAAQLAGIASVKAAVARGVDPLATPILSGYREALRRIRDL